MNTYHIYFNYLFQHLALAVDMIYIIMLIESGFLNESANSPRPYDFFVRTWEILYVTQLFCELLPVLCRSL